MKEEATERRSHGATEGVSRRVDIAHQMKLSSKRAEKTTNNNTISKTTRWVMLATCCVFASSLLAQTTGKQSNAPTVVYIVRHAEKTGDTPDADLSPEGKQRAEVLKWMLRDVEFDAVYSTKVPRTLHTVEPIAKARELMIQYYAPEPGALAMSIRQLDGGRTILVGGHSNTIPELLKSLGVPVEEKILAAYDDLFIVVLHGSGAGAKDATLQRLHYPGRR